MDDLEKIVENGGFGPRDPDFRNPHEKSYPKMASKAKMERFWMTFGKNDETEGFGFRDTDFRNPNEKSVPPISSMTDKERF